MKLLLDQGIPYSTCKYLQQSGLSVVHTVDLKMQSATDREIIEYAKENYLICVTLDSDFHSIIALEGKSAPSAIRIRIEGLDGKRMSELLVTIIEKTSKQIMKGALITVNTKSIRVKSLPIR